MRGFVTGLSFLGVLAFGAVLAGCGPSKPCQCAQQSGCHCPLPPVSAKEAKPVIPPTPNGNELQTTHRVQRVAHRMHLLRHAHSQRNYAALVAHAHHRGTREERQWPLRVHPRFTNALPYNYHSALHSYRTGERFAENHDGYASPEPNYGHYGYRKHHRYSRDGVGERGYGERYGEEASSYAQDGYSEGPNAEGPEDYYSGNAGTAMSINSPAALDPWHGYDADCPDVYSGQ